MFCRERAQRGQRGSLGPLGLVAGLSLSCIGTDLDSSGQAFVCAEADVVTPALDAVVLINGVGSDAPACTGIALAPKLVATALSCVTPSRFLPVVCDEEAGWRPIETGDFASWLATPDPGDSTVSSARVGAGELEGDVSVGVAKVLPMHAGSACSDDVALLVLTVPLALPRPTLRLGAGYRSGEAVIVRGRSEPSSRNPHSTISAITGDQGDDILPPRSLAVDVGTCPADRGGALFSEETGALLGIVQWATEECGGRTVALQLEPFRRLLAEGAAAAETALLLERRSDSDGPDCSEGP